MTLNRIVITSCAVMAVVAALGYELLRNKGEILVIGTARESGSEVILNLVVKNRDWRISLSNFYFEIKADEFWDVKAVRRPQDVKVETNTYGPNNEWTAIDVSLKPDWTLKGGEKFEAEFVLRRKTGDQPRINGSVAYSGASR